MESGRGCGEGTLGRGFIVNFLMLDRGVNDSFPDAMLSSSPSNSLDLSF